MVKKIIVSVLMATLTGAIGWAQDPFYSQYFHAPVALNPAFAGTAKQDLRITLLNRRQWINVPSGINHVAAAIEKNILGTDDNGYERDTWCIAGSFNSSTEGYLNTNQASLTIAREFNGSHEDAECKEPYISVGLQLGFVKRNARLDKLWFSNQIDRDGLILGSRPAIDYLPYAKIAFGNASMGFVATYHNFMVGAAFYRPLTLNWERTLIDGIASDDARLPKRSTFHLSYFYDTDHDNPLSLKIKPTAIVQLQGGRMYANVGAIINMPEAPVEIGCWYRYSKGLVTTHGFGIGVNIALGPNRLNLRYSKIDQYDNDFYRIGTSYDFELSGPTAGNTGGSIEIGGVYERKVDERNCKPRPDCSKTYPWMYF